MANIGIDLGTTHSLVAVVLNGEARCLLDDEERALLPSAVRYDDAGNPMCIGYPALEAAGSPGGTTFTSIKRFMGRSASEVAAMSSEQTTLPGLSVFGEAPTRGHRWFHDGS